jgi:hypothetical protein
MKKRVPPHCPSAPKPAAQGVWEGRLRPFLERRSVVLAMALVAIATLRIVATWHVFANTGDEPAHLAAGMQYLSQHAYNYDRQHAPMACMMGALGPFLAGARSQGYRGFVQEGMAIINYQGHPELTIDLMRTGVLPFFLLACFVVYAWSAHYFSKAVAVLATGLFTLVPPILAHAGIACTDMALAGCLGAAFLALILWAEDPTWKRTILLGVAVASAILSRFTAMGFLAAAALLALAARLVSHRDRLAQIAAVARTHALRFPAAALVTAFLVWAGYLFSFGKVPGWDVSLPAPEFFDGIRMAVSHSQAGHPAYLLGQFGSQGWWYYFLVALGVKSPLAFLLLALPGLYFCLRGWRDTRYWLPVAFAMGILLPAITSHVNIGLRLILPIYIALAIAGALTLVQLAESSATRKWAAIAALLLPAWLIYTGAACHPDYLAYFNELVASEPDKVLVDSDYDWGQDTKRLAQRLRQLGATSVSFGGIGAADDEFLQTFPGLPPITHIHPLNPAEGYTAVSPTLWRTVQYGLYYKHPEVKPWFERLQPKERVGVLLLYHIPPGSLRRVR